MNQIPQIFDVVIVGGGLAGLSSAIHLSKNNLNVLLIEKNNYPKHKVCGEYISNEVLPYLEYLGIDVFGIGAQKINKFELSTPQNNILKSDLTLGGFGISRYELDNALYEKVKSQHVEIVQDSVIDIKFLDDVFSVDTKNNNTYRSKLVIGAYGKRSALDVTLERNFIKKKSPFLAVKTHVKGDFPNDLVALHNFKGGYCGVSKVENNIINLCYITDYDAFKTYKDIEEFQEKVVFKNTYLKTIFQNSTPVFERPLTISQISFSNKNPIENHVIMCGDTAGMIHPLCGNGMSMAIRSAQMASQLIIDYLQGKIKSRQGLENAYQKSWNNEFRTRLKVGHFVAKLFSKNKLADLLVTILKLIPKLLPQIIKQTHGKPMVVK
ncbi:NAD(P)/FAD-dependent oxidoreductase [Yeosuana marina]|uniref:NAD(P)/FAD-dependent oxidoreductase n=1 Tax=Yeosuana marina TaxID=1565536 RepID=UPI0030C7E374